MWEKQSEHPPLRDFLSRGLHRHRVASDHYKENTRQEQKRPLRRQVALLSADAIMGPAEETYPTSEAIDAGLRSRLGQGDGMQHIGDGQHRSSAGDHRARVVSR